VKAGEPVTATQSLARVRLDCLLNTVHNDNTVMEPDDFKEEEMTATEKERVNTFKVAISAAIDSYTDFVVEQFPDHLLSLVVSFFRSQIHPNRIRKPEEVAAAYGELNERNQLDGFCYLKYKNGKYYQGMLSNGEIYGSYAYMVQSWAKVIGFTHMQLQENQSFALVIDDRFEFNFGLLKASNMLLIVSYFKHFKVKELSDAIRMKLYQKMLTKNFESSKGALGICPKGEQVTMNWQFDMQYMHIKKFNTVFSRTIDMSEKFEVYLKELQKENDALQQETPATT